MTEIRFRPFANGSQWMDWEGANCARCTKSEMDADGLWPLRCEVLRALLEAQMGDGTVSEEMGARMGTGPNEGRYCWPCNEVEWTEAWKAEYRRKYLGKVPS